jgi:hypothetical protein
MLAHVDDNELPKKGPSRIKARDRPPTWEPKIQRRRQERGLKTRKGKRREAQREEEKCRTSQNYPTHFY